MTQRALLDELLRELTQSDAFARLVALRVVATLNGAPLTPTSGTSLPGPASRNRLTNSVARVRAAIQAGAATKKEIVARVGVTSMAYRYSIAALRLQGLIRTRGTRRQARFTAR